MKNLFILTLSSTVLLLTVGTLIGVKNNTLNWSEILALPTLGDVYISQVMYDSGPPVR